MFGNTDRSEGTSRIAGNVFIEKFAVKVTKSAGRPMRGSGENDSGKKKLCVPIRATSPLNIKALSCWPVSMNLVSTASATALADARPRSAKRSKLRHTPLTDTERGLEAWNIADFMANESCQNDL